MVLVLMRFTLLTKLLRIGVEAAKRPQNVLVVHAELSQLCAQRGSIGCFFWAVAAIAAARISWADGAAPCVGHRAKAWHTPRDHHTDGAAQLALYTDAVRRRIRLALVQISADDLEQLLFVN